MKSEFCIITGNQNEDGKLSFENESKIFGFLGSNVLILLVMIKPKTAGFRFCITNYSM